MSPLDELEALLAEEWPTDESGVHLPAYAWSREALARAAVAAAPRFVRLARTAIKTIAAPGPLTFTGPSEDRPRCLFCGAPVNSGDCCLDEMRAVLRELTQERSSV